MTPYRMEPPEHVAAERDRLRTENGRLRGDLLYWIREARVHRRFTAIVFLCLGLVVGSTVVGAVAVHCARTLFAPVAAPNCGECVCK